MTGIAEALVDGRTIAKRNIIKIKRVPGLLVSTLVGPIMMVLMFAYVFGGSIDVPSANYREFLIAGIFAQTLIFGSVFTGAAMADDMQKGVIDRFRSLPISRSSVLIGRTASDIVNNGLSIVVMTVTGLLIGWRVHTSVLEAVAGFGLLLLFAYAFSWIMAYIGMLVPSAEVVNNSSFIVIFPLTFIANTFVPSESLPGPLRVFADWNPVSAVTQAARELFGNVPSGIPSDVWALQHPVLYTLLWTGVILAVFVPLATRRYRQVGSH